MWKKKSENIKFSDLVKLATIMKKLGGLLYRITWKTADGLAHLCSFTTFEESKPEQTALFTLWELTDDKK